ncbi:MAG: hypothetical protein II945_05120 [Bacteroidales bacterium]|nr:hypothetical protein [Bacteroidales bacterium]
MANRTVDDRTEMLCTRCGQIRPVSRFSIVKERLKNGETRRYYVSVCKYCVSERKHQKGEKMLPGSRQTSLSVFNEDTFQETFPLPPAEPVKLPAESVEAELVEAEPVEPVSEPAEATVHESPRCKRCVHYSLIRHKCKNKLCDFDEFLGYAMPCEI